MRSEVIKMNFENRFSLRQLLLIVNYLPHLPRLDWTTPNCNLIVQREHNTSQQCHFHAGH